MIPAHELTTDEAVLELEQVCDQLSDALPSLGIRRELQARKHELEAWILMHQGVLQNPPIESIEEPETMARTAEEKAAQKNEYQRKWRAKKLAAEGKAPAVKRNTPAVQQKATKTHTSEKPVQETPKAVHVPAPEGAQVISKIRASIWALMAGLEHMTPAQRSGLVNDLALLDAAAHAAHQLALGRLEVA